MNDSYNREATVVTPEHVRLQFRTAGLGSRTAAQLIDVLLLMLVFGAVCLLIGLALMVMGIGVNDMPGEYALAFIIVFSSVLSGGYFVLAEYYMNGQTVGKKQLGLRVIQENGQPVTFLSAIIRNFFSGLSISCLGYIFWGGCGSFSIRWIKGWAISPPARSLCATRAGNSCIDAAKRRNG